MNIKCIVHFLCNQQVTSQILTAFHLWGLKMNAKVIFEDHRKDKSFDKIRLPLVWVEYDGKIICYDMQDGYLNIPAMQYWISYSDMYFKRSYSEELNANLLGSPKNIRPLGFNYFLSWSNNPINDSKWIRIIKRIIGKTPRDAFTVQAYECPPSKSINQDNIHILYWARLWEPQAGLTNKQVKQRESANLMRIEIVKILKSVFDKKFIGGVSDTPFARTMVSSDLFCSSELKDKGKYIDIAKSCDICVATEGLHRSNGWKLAEYIAASKAIVCEHMFYTVPGNFSMGKNYLPFSTPEECVEAIRKLIDSPEMLLKMQHENYYYYNEYLSPVPFITRTLQHEA